MRSGLFVSFVAYLLAAHPASAQESNALDPATGLIKAPGWEMVRAHCSGCHSTALVTQQRANKTQWRKLIRWMQAEQNLWPIPAPAEDIILSYLARYYAAPKAQRRAPLPRELLPRDPNATKPKEHE